MGANETSFAAGRGSAKAPAFTFFDDPDTGLFREDAGLSLSLNGTIVARFTHEGLISTPSVSGVGYVNPLQFGVALTDVTLGLAIDSIGSSPLALLLTPGTWAISNDLTIPSNIILIRYPGSSVSVAEGATLTINGPVSGPLNSWISGDGSTVIGGTVREVYPQWWGAVGDDSTDNAPFFRAMFNDSPVDSVCYIPPGTYRIGSMLEDVLKSGMTIRGAGMGQTVLKSTEVLADAAADLGEGGYALFSNADAVSRVTFEDLSFSSTTTEAKMEAQANGNVRGHSAVYISSGDDITFRNVEVTNWGGRALYVGDVGTVSNRLRFEGCYAHDTWSDALDGVNVTDLWFVNNKGLNIHPADTDDDGVYDSQFADFCHASSSRNVHFIGNSCENVARVAYLSEGTLAVPGENIMLSNNYAESVGFGCPDDTGSAVWLENTTGLFTCSDFLFDQCEMGIVIARENGHIILGATISNGTIRLHDVPQTTGKADDLYGCIRSRAESTLISNVAFKQGLPATSPDNGFHTISLLSAQSIIIENCLFDGSPERAHIMLNLDAPVTFGLKVTGCTFRNSDCRIISQTGTGAANECERFVFSNNIISNELDDDTINLISLASQNDVTKYVEFNENVITVTAATLGIADFDAKFISVRGNSIVSTDASQDHFLNLARFEHCTVCDNTFDGVTVIEKLVINGGSAPYTHRYAVVARNTFVGASPDHVDFSNLTAGLLQGNNSAGATTRAYTTQATAVDMYVVGNHAAETSLCNLQSDTITGRNWVNGAPVPAKGATATVANGATTVVVTHGLPYTPDASDIIINRTNAPTGVTHFWLSTFTSTQFTINVNADPGATTATFTWQARGA